MKEISELNLPEDIRYTKTHEWAKKIGKTIKVGLTDYAQNQLGDIVFVELPKIGESFSKGDEFGNVESVKAVSEIYMPVGGEVVAVNQELESTPELVNQNPYSEGWLIELKPTHPAEWDALLDKAAYLVELKG
ncbi:glycine cleavage system protein GcvH [bacterium]|nr:glycine cleavage system protein GcvH [bacterium]